MQNYKFVHFNLYIFDSRWDDKRFWTKW